LEFRVRTLLLLAIWSAAATPPLSAQAQSGSMAAAVQIAQSTPPFDHALLMVDIEDDAGNVLYAQNAHTLMIPASVRKLFSAATVQQCLGFDAQFQTELWRDGDDVIIKGGGDPSFGAERYGYDDRNTFAPFIAALRAHQIERVRDVIADVSLFDRVTIPYQWKVGNLTSIDASPVDALIDRENAIGDDAVSSGGFFTALNFRDALEQAGIAVTGVLRLQTEPRAWAERLGAIDSPFVEQLLMTILKNSQNLYAETLYKRMSAGEKPASYSASRDIESAFLTNEVGIDPAEFRFVDGSGLAPDDLVTPAAIVKILRWMNEPERRSFWWAVMAQPGQEGTLKKRLLTYSDRLRGKTGTVAGVNTLAGFVAGRDGTLRYFALGWNHHLGSSATKLLDAIVDAVADF
jgi:serine-type D-Ala-D-Ala carboxypeptidase/endopeptidase (penicillin-binding protein 4)